MKHMILYLSLIIVSLLSAGFYRLGGGGNDMYERLKDKYPFLRSWMFNTKVRDLGCPMLCVGWLYFFLGCPWWAFLLSVGVMYGSLTTYNKWATRLFYGKECNDVKWISWAVTGLSYGVALFIIAWATGHWAGLLYRSIMLMVTISIWSEMIGKDWVEESGRGFLLGITLPLMLI